MKAQLLHHVGSGGQVLTEQFQALLPGGKEPACTQVATGEGQLLQRWRREDLLGKGWLLLGRTCACMTWDSLELSGLAALPSPWNFTPVGDS